MNFQTEQEITLPVFEEDLWTSILRPYQFAPASVLSLAQVFYSLREDIRRGNAELAVAVLTDGIHKLYPFSEQYKAGHTDYWQAVKGDV
jgi:hypothetical protein